MCGLHLDEWQQWHLTEALSEGEDRKWSAFEVAAIVGRQNGKGSIEEARQLAGLTILHERLQVHTAHEFRTCFEHFLRICQLIETNPDIDRKVMRVRRGAGEQAIEMIGGERLRFLARSGGSGRGMTGDVVYLDEAFALTPPMMGALLPTLSSRPNPQVWYASSAPMATSVVLHGIRKRAIEGNSPRLFYAEWGNDPGTDPDDRKAWRRANPALGIRIDEEFIEAERQAMPEHEFLRERLGIPDPLPDDTSAKDVKIPAEAWAATAQREQEPDPIAPIIAVDCAPNGDWASIAIGTGTLSNPYVEVIEHRQGLGWVPARMLELIAKWSPTAVGIDGGGPAGALVGPLMAALAGAGISTDLVHQMTAAEMKQGCAGFYNDVVEGRLRRPATGQGPLEIAVADAAERTVGDAWLWDRRSATVPICPLVAVTIARALLSAEVDAPFAGSFTDLDDFDLDDL